MGDDASGMQGVTDFGSASALGFDSTVHLFYTAPQDTGKDLWNDCNCVGRLDSFQFV